MPNDGRNRTKKFRIGIGALRTEIAATKYS